MRSFFAQAVLKPATRKRSDRGRRAVLETLEGRTLQAAGLHIAAGAHIPHEVVLLSHHARELAPAPSHDHDSAFWAQQEDHDRRNNPFDPFFPGDADTTERARGRERTLINLFANTAKFQAFISNRVQIRY
jgi:hypothetical protein